MSVPNLSARAAFDVERTRAAAFSGSYQTLGTALTQNPVIMVFDNLSTVDVAVSVDGVNNWKTFQAGEGLVLDLRANHGVAPNFAIDVGTQFYVIGSGGTGLFSLSILYGR